MGNMQCVNYDAKVIHPQGATTDKTPYIVHKSTSKPSAKAYYLHTYILFCIIIIIIIIIIVVTFVCSVPFAYTTSHCTK